MENTETKTQWKGNFADVRENDDNGIVVEAPVFIIFAEYLGYISRFNKLALEWCEGKVPESYVQKIMIMEAKTIFRQMQKDYTLPTIKYWYNTYYPVILEEYVTSLTKVLENNNEE